MKNAIDRYVQDVMKNLDCSRLWRNRTKLRLKEDLSNAGIGQNASYEEILDSFGNPADVALELLETVPSSKRNVKRKAKTIILSAALIFALLVIGLAVYVIRELLKNANATYTDEIFAEDVPYGYTGFDEAE
jgi:hypothetical protein